MYMETGEWSITFSRSTIAYSYDGIAWTGLGTTIFTSFGLEVAWNGSMWVAVGGGFNSIAYSYDGINWTGLGKSVLTGYGHAIAWNGTMWVVPGAGSNTLAYSYDGINWTGLGNSIFSGAYGVAWNGRMWIAVGEGSNAVAYSYDGITWVGLGNMSFTAAGVGVAWNGTMWILLSGGGANTIAYSYDGLNWISEGNNGTINARYVRFEYSNALVSRYLQIAGVRVYNAAGTNIITTSMTVTASYVNISNPASTVLDGDIGTFYHSDLSTSPWLEIDLGSEQVIHKVEFVNRGDCCRGRIAGARLVLKNNSGTVVYTSNTMTLKDGVTTTYQDYPGNEGYLYYNWWPIISTYAYGSDTSPFMFETSAFNGARKLAWNGNMWLAGGGGINTLAYSYNGINWIGLGNVLGAGVVCMATAFNSARPHQITFPASMMVATGSGTNTLAYSADGVSWTGSGLGVFSTQGNGVASNGSMWVATGSGTNTLAYSTTDIETPYIYLPFENGLSKDVMGNSTTVVYGAPSFITGVRGSTAVNFVNTAGGIGTNYLKVPWTGSTSFTISFWFNAQTINGIQQDIFTNTSGNLCFYINSSGNLGFYIPTGGAGSGTNATVTSYTISTNTWYNVTGIFQAYGICSLYVNNVLVGSSTNIGGLGTGTMDMWMGSWQTAAPFNGFIDDVRIYNYAITMNPKIIWRGLGTSVFSTQGKGVAWNGSMWVAVGGGTNSIAYSYDGITWIATTSIFSSSGFGIAWNGTMWVAVGGGTNSIATSYDGISWIGLGTSIFSGSGNGIAWNGSMWVAVGTGRNSIAYSYNGKTWTGLGTTLFSSSGNGIAWNGSRWVAVGSGTNTILYSTNGINWSAAASSCFTGYGSGITWNGSKWVATGSGTNTIGYSSDGSTWIAANAVSQNITPNQTSLASNTWTQNGVTWTSSASTTYNAGYPAYGAFNNYYGNTGVYSWATPVLYSVSNGSYSGSVSTTIQAGIGSKTGEWLQIQSSVPLVLSSYTYGCGANGQVPKTYYIIGSNDNSTWYPIQSCVMSVNPLTAFFTVCTTYIVVNQSGTQTIFGGQTGSGTFTTYPPYTTAAYTYFRIILQTLWNTGTNGNAEFGEFYPNFNGTTNFSTAGSNIASNLSLSGSVNIQHPVVAVGQGVHTLAYSPDGIRWTGLGTTMFSGAGYSVAWNGTRWVAGGLGSNTLAYSYDGLRWTGLGATIFSAQVNGIAWNGSVWVAVGAGSNAIAYSADGLSWIGSPSANAIFTSCNAVAWNGAQWVAVGAGTNSIAVSTDGFVWNAYGSTVFSTQGNGVYWTGSLWVAVGSGTNTIAYSTNNGISWTGLGTSIFSTSGNGVCWNGTRWVAVGSGTNTIAYSMNGTSWFGIGTNVLPLSGNGVCWTGTRFVAVGDTVGYSTDGLTWYVGSNNVFTQGNGVAGNPRIGAVVCDSQVALSDSTTLDVVSDTYYNTGYTNFSAAIQAKTYTVDPTSIATVIKTLPGAPTNVVGATYPAGAVIGIRVSFTYPSNTGGGVEAYYASAIDTAGLQPTVTVSSVTQPISLTTGLIPGTTYRFQAYSSNSAGQSTATAGGSNVFFQIPPSAPQNYTAVLSPPHNPTSIIISFTAPSNLGGGITNYVVTPSLGSAQTGLALSYTFTGFTAGTFYTFSTAGYNTGGTGAAAIASITYYTKPDAPIVQSITFDPPVTPTGVNVGFTTIGYAGGGTLTYVATAYDSNSAVVSSASGSTTPIKLTGLTAGASYSYRVVASNLSVSSSVSDSMTMIYYSQPSIPRSVSAVSGITTASISWQEPSDKGGSAVVTYRVVSIPAAYDSGVQGISGTSLTATGLTNGIAYQFRVTVTNIGGLSNFATSASTMIGVVPSAPIITGTQAYLSATLNWADPPSDNGAAIDQYAYSINNGNSWTSFGNVSSRSVNIPGISVNTTANYVIRAHNGVGWGPASNTITYIYPASQRLAFFGPSSDWGSGIIYTYAVIQTPNWENTVVFVSATLRLRYAGTIYTFSGYEASRNGRYLVVNFNTPGFDASNSWFDQYYVEYVLSNSYGGTETYST